MTHSGGATPVAPAEGPANQRCILLANHANKKAFPPRHKVARDHPGRSRMHRMSRRYIPSNLWESSPKPRGIREVAAMTVRCALEASARGARRRLDRAGKAAS